MAKGIFIIGTDTNVGKTFVSSLIIKAMIKEKKSVCYYKPVASGCVFIDEEEFPEDVNLVNEISGFKENVKLICPFWFKAAVSPHLAAKVENVEIDIGLIKANYEKIKQKYEYVVVEGCGGLAVPLIDEKYFVSDLIKDLDLKCFLVIRAGVGTINHTLLTVRYANYLGIKIEGIIVNHYNNKFYEKDNISMINKMLDIPIVAKIPTINLDQLHSINEEFINFGNIEKYMSEV